MKAIRIHRTGGPEVLAWEEVPLRAPAPGEVLVRHTAIGVNFIDTYHRSGLYPLPALPAVLGREAAGIVAAVGAGVTRVAEGDRVGYPLHPGAYAESAIVPEAALVAIPEGIDDRTAAAAMLKGLTAWYLVRRSHPVREGEAILVHAAAGGVGLLLCQWASRLGAIVLGTVGNPAKAELAAAHGCRHPIDYTREDFVARVREITGGRGVRAVYDSVGKDTFERSLDCLAPCGILVSFGQSSGPVAPFAPGLLAAKGSLYLQRPTLATYIADRADLEAGASELFGAIRDGGLRVEIGRTYALREARRAHEDLEGRRTTGSILLLPDTGGESR